MKTKTDVSAHLTEEEMISIGGGDAAQLVGLGIATGIAGSYMCMPLMILMYYNFYKD